MNKKIFLLFGMIFLGVFLITIVSAEFWACFKQGEVIKYCSNYRPSETYTGSYPLCMSVYRAPENCYVHGVWSKCNNLDPANCAVSGNGTTQFDFTPPILKIITPTNNSIFNSRKIFLNFTLDETATVYYRDLDKPTVSWIKLCDKCNPGTLANPSYAKLRSFAEGQNRLLFKAVDVTNNDITSQLTFFIDSIKPRIYRTEPRANSFADGNFEVQFKETNPKKLTLIYGNATKNETASLNLSKCRDEMSKKVCEIEVNLNKYNAQTLGYYFEIEDIAGNKYSSKPTLVKVDTKAPVVNNPSSFFKVDGNYVEFNISIDEPNLYKVSILRNLGTRTTSTTLCTRLTNGYCYKKQSFTGGDYTLSVQIIDQAGHSIAIPATFKIK